MKGYTELNVKISAVQTFRVSLVVVILRQTVAEVFDSLPAGPTLCTLMKYSVTFCSRLEADSDVISGEIV